MTELENLENFYAPKVATTQSMSKVRSNDMTIKMIIKMTDLRQCNLIIKKDQVKPLPREILKFIEN